MKRSRLWPKWRTKGWNPFGTIGVDSGAAFKLTCQTCPSKAKCCPNTDARKSTREEFEDARQLARDIAKTRQYKVSMKLRKKVEMLFAHPSG